ncbi:hypothetical protein BDV40DRAFT_271587 [Aspergillus tamarii]|uniref:Uncharacterized protein n=1 Tax=Aspergillus tamarii TaxID=41984 RepID=A0A5N6UN34_ASPTM|nr:hypothetical protein BDV40DRAFT_271587 [Aspergillus tamarii]
MSRSCVPWKPAVMSHRDVSVYTLVLTPNSLSLCLVKPLHMFTTSCFCLTLLYLVLSINPSTVYQHGLRLFQEKVQGRKATCSSIRKMGNHTLRRDHEQRNWKGPSSS